MAFVTADREAPLVGPPLVELCGVNGAGCVNVTGHATRAAEPQLPSRVLTYSFVPLPMSLTPPGARLTYRALPGTSLAAWSEAFELNIPPAGAVQKFAIFGDQGVYPYSSIGNLIDDYAQGKIQSVIMLGDLAYNLGMANGTRGDGYLYALQPLLASIPWVTVEGNHELEASPFGSYCPETEYCEGRYLNQSAGYLVAGEHSGSNTNLYFSLDVGLVHFIVINTMQYLSLGPDLKARQLAWLRADLAAASAPAQRKEVPWIIALTHVPMYCSAIGQEDVGGLSREDLEPLLFEGGVDLYFYGHVHAYESTWPVGPNGAVASNPSLVNPRAPVHVLTGAAGPPGGPDSFNATSKPKFSRTSYGNWSYGRVQVFNTTHLTYSHIDNYLGTVVDEWTIVQENHGPF